MHRRSGYDNATPSLAFKVLQVTVVPLQGLNVGFFGFSSGPTILTEMKLSLLETELMV